MNELVEFNLTIRPLPLPFVQLNVKPLLPTLGKLTAEGCVVGATTLSVVVALTVTGVTLNPFVFVLPVL